MGRPLVQHQMRDGAFIVFEKFNLRIGYL